MNPPEPAPLVVDKRASAQQPNRNQRRAEAKRAPAKKSPGLTQKQLEDRVDELERQVATLAYLHTELSYKINLAIAKQVTASKMPELQRQMEDMVVKKLMAGESPSG